MPVVLLPFPLPLDRLNRNVITPTTKAETHDVPISPKEIVAQGLMSQEDWDAVSEAALKLFEFGQRQVSVIHFSGGGRQGAVWSGVRRCL